MIDRILLAACLIAALAACEPAQEKSVVGGPIARDPAPAVDENHSMTAAPEHFDRVRTEQFEKEEDRLRKRSRN
jgi:hypothetical protein